MEIAKQNKDVVCELVTSAVEKSKWDKEWREFAFVVVGEWRQEGLTESSGWIGVEAGRGGVPHVTDSMEAGGVQDS